MAGSRHHEVLLTDVELIGATGTGAEGSAPAGTGNLLIAGSTIARIGWMEPRPRLETMDGTGWRLAPGLIDLQVNGGWGHDLTTNPEAIWTVGARLAPLGVTAWLPTLVSADRATRHHALEVLAAGPPHGWSGAVPLGWHFEGPYLNPNRRGAHSEACLEPVPSALAAPAPDPDLGDEPLPLLMTMAPELPGAIEAIANLSRVGVKVSIGHSEAEPDVVADAVAAGATMATHLFNAMGGLHHRQPGTAAGLLDSPVRLGLIVDHHHVAPELIRLVWSAAADRIVVVSDATSGLGRPDGRTVLSGVEVSLVDGAARLADGALAGTVTSLIDGVRNLAAVTGSSLDQVLATATRNPAEVLGDATRGRLEVGCRADLVAFDVDDQVAAVFIEGRRLPVEPPDPTAAGS